MQNSVKMQIEALKQNFFKNSFIININKIVYLK